MNSHESERSVDFGPFTVDFGTRECIFPDGSWERLTHRELQVLTRLFSSGEQFRSSQSIGTSIAAIEYPNVDPVEPLSDAAIQMQIASLRDKLGGNSI